MTWFGIDVGGSGIKGAEVDLVAGGLATKRHRIPTPQPSTPTAVAATIADVVAHFGYGGPIGVTMPSVIIGGVVHTAANIDPSWVGVDVDGLLEDHLKRDVVVLNDADAAGLAEMRFGAGEGRTGTVWVVTLGTGIGSAVFSDGVLVRNTEFGHLRIADIAAEKLASAKVREDGNLSWQEWAARLNEYFSYAESLIWPELIIIGGGVSKEWSDFGYLLDTRAPIVPAILRNHAGIVGAAMMAQMAFGGET